MNVCVLVPAYNEQAMLDRTLAAAVREVGRENVFLANDASTDITARIGAYWTGEARTYTAPANQGKSRTLKAAIDHFELTSRYDAIFILDADTYLCEGHIARLLPELEAGVAFVVGRIESSYEANFWVRYRAFVMWKYNVIIRTPQAILGIVNVLPGSSVLLSSRAVEAVDWERASRLILDDFSMLCDVQYEGIGKIRYVHDSPAARIDEPKSWAAYKRQTWGRWWPGIWQTMRDRRMLRRTDWFSLANNVQIGEWLFTCFWPVIVLVWCLTFLGTLWAWALPAMVLWGLVQIAFFGALYVARTGRVSTLYLLPAFLVVAQVESVLFAASYVKSAGVGGGAWQSPERR